VNAMLVAYPSRSEHWEASLRCRSAAGRWGLAPRPAMEMLKAAWLGTGRAVGGDGRQDGDGRHGGALFFVLSYSHVAYQTMAAYLI
jgi:hypothetical protein